MPLHLQLLAAAVVLHFAMILVGALISARLHTVSGYLWAAGARDRPLEGEPSALAGRADRAAKNMMENMTLFTPVLLAGHLGGVAPATLTLGAGLFLGARVVYWPLYLFGVPQLRTVSWVVSLLGIARILVAMF